MLAFPIHGKTYNSHSNIKFRISSPTCNGKFELLNGSNFISDIQDYFSPLKKKKKMEKYW